MKYTIGQKIYYTGDNANNSGWFEIIELVGSKYSLKEINGEYSEGRTFLLVPNASISEKYTGNYAYRLVTEKAYKDYRKEALGKLLQKTKKYEEVV